MNPDKLFDYLEGKLDPATRAELENRVMSEPELQRELALARQIHSRIRDSRAVLDQLHRSAEVNRGAVLGRRIAIIFTVLVFLNVLFGIYAIGFMGKKQRASPPNEQSQQELTRALQNAAATALPTPTLDVDEIKVPATKAQEGGVAEKIMAAAKECGGSAARNLSNDNGLLLFAEIPAVQENSFRDKLARLGAAPSKAAENTPAAGNKIVQIRVVEQSRR